MFSTVSQWSLLLIAILITAWAVALSHEGRIGETFSGHLRRVLSGWTWPLRAVMLALLCCCTLHAQKQQRPAQGGGEDGQAAQEEPGGGGMLMGDNPAAIAQWWLDENRDPADSDGDGIPDGWERIFGLDPADPDDAALDRDGDGLTELEEFLNRCHPLRRDTDGDGMDDLFEVSNGLCPWRPDDTEDADGDGLDNFHEMVFGTGVNDPDTNGDGRLDGEEADEGVDPASSEPDAGVFGASLFKIRIVGTGAARRAAVSVRHILHTGVAEREYAVAAGESYEIRLFDLEPDNTNACSGSVLFVETSGVMFDGFTNSFTLPLEGGSSSAPEGSGFATFNAVAGGDGLLMGSMVAVGLVFEKTPYCIDCLPCDLFHVNAVMIPEGLELGSPSFTWDWSAGYAYPQADGGVAVSTDASVWQAEEEGVLSCTFSASGVSPKTHSLTIKSCGSYTNSPPYVDPYIRCLPVTSTSTNIYVMRSDPSPISFDWVGSGGAVTWKINSMGSPSAHFVDPVSGNPCVSVKNAGSVSVKTGVVPHTNLIRGTSAETKVTRTIHMSVMDFNFEPITPPGSGALPVNPSGLAVGEDAYFRATSLSGITGSELNWTCNNGHAEIVGNAAGEQVQVHAVSEGDLTVGISIDNYVGPPISAKLHVFPAVTSEVAVKAFIVCDNYGSNAPVLLTDINERMAFANKVFLQAGIRFNLASVGVVSNFRLPDLDGK